jgi:hypothetical protein
MIADRHHIRHFSIQYTYGGIGVLPLREVASAIHNIAESRTSFIFWS